MHNFVFPISIKFLIYTTRQATQILFSEAGANPLKANDYGRQPKDYARDPRIKKLLKNYSDDYTEIKKQQEMEQRRKFPLEMRLKEHIVGQESAITTVASAIR